MNGERSSDEISGCVPIPYVGAAAVVSGRGYTLNKLPPVNADVTERLRERLRRPPTEASVPVSLPVLFFGDLFSARVVTVGLNPSDQEYTDGNGRLLTGVRQRFATLRTLGTSERGALDDAACDEAIRWMRHYFEPGKPIYRWFTALERVVGGLGASFADGTAAHLDLVQEATRPTWSALPAGDRGRLLAADLPFLEWQLRAFDIAAVICTGKTVSEHVRSRLGVTVENTGALARIKWWVGSAQVNGKWVGFAGWNYPLARPTGLGASGERQLGELLRERLNL